MKRVWAVADVMLSRPSPHREGAMSLLQARDAGFALQVRNRMGVLEEDSPDIALLVQTVHEFSSEDNREAFLSALRLYDPSLYRRLDAVLQAARPQPETPVPQPPAPIGSPDLSNFANWDLSGATSMAGMFAPRTAPPHPVPPYLQSVIDEYSRVVRERMIQRVRTGDWVSILAHNKQFSIVRNTTPVAGKKMLPGTPLTYVGVVNEVNYRVKGGVMYEHVTIRIDKETFEGEKVMPGATDGPLLLPCARPGCTNPHLNRNPFCRNHPAPSLSSDEHIGTVRGRLADLRALAARELLPEVQRALAADIDFLNQWVTDRTDALRRFERAEAERARLAAERLRAEAQTAEQKERELLAQLAAKYGAKLTKPAGDIPTSGERNLEL